MSSTDVLGAIQAGPGGQEHIARNTRSNTKVPTISHEASLSYNDDVSPRLVAVNSASRPLSKASRDDAQDPNRPIDLDGFPRDASSIGKSSSNASMPDAGSVKDWGTTDDEMDDDDSPQELEQRAQFLENGRRSALEVWKHREAIPKEVLETYEGHYKDFQWYWIEKMRPKHESSLRGLSTKLRRLEEEHDQTVGIWNKVENLKASITILAGGWSNLRSHPETNVKNELVSFINKVSELGLNIGLMVGPQRMQEARRILEEDHDNLDLLQAAMSVPRSVAMADLVRNSKALECLQVINPARTSTSKEMQGALKELRRININIVSNNDESGYNKGDRNLPLRELKLAIRSRDANGRAAFVRALMIMDLEGHQVSNEFPELLQDLANEAFDAREFDTIQQEFFPGLVIQPADIPERAVTQTSRSPAITWDPDTYVDECPAANDIATGVTDFGKIVHVRTTGGRSPGCRVIVNTGTEKKPLYDCVAGAELGRGEAKRIQDQQQSRVITKDRQRCHVERPIGMVQVESRYRRIDNSTSGRNPITYFLVRWSNAGREGEFSGTPEEQWLTRTELSFCGKRTIEQWCDHFKARNQHNRQLLENLKERGIHPDTGLTISPLEASQQPWLLSRKKKVRSTTERHQMDALPVRRDEFSNSQSSSDDESVL